VGESESRTTNIKFEAALIGFRLVFATLAIELPAMPTSGRNYMSFYKHAILTGLVHSYFGQSNVRHFQNIQILCFHAHHLLFKFSNSIKIILHHVTHRQVHNVVSLVYSSLLTDVQLE
jgi:hypothetical protein